ncbi:uncharacterized protein LOC122172980 isoform X3 [Chrysemys picta bellii]
MENIQMSDEGQYTCVVGYGAERQQSETTLHVLAAPRLSIPRRAARTDTATSFPCHVWGFYPGDVTVTWLRDGRVLTDTTRSAPQSNPDGTFNLTLTYTFTPIESDSSSIFSCRVSHAALAQPLQEEFPLDVTVSRAGADHTSAAIGATLGILVAGGAAAAIAIYCWRKRREGPYSAVETPAKDAAGSGDKTRGEDTVGMGNEGVSGAGEGSEQQPLLPAQGQEQSETQEQEDRLQVTGRSDSPGSELSECQERGKAVAAAPGPRAPGPNGDSSANAEAGPAGPGMAGASAELAGQQGRDAAPSITTVGTRETAPNMVPATAQEEDVQGEPGDKGLLRPPEVSEISQPQSVTAGEEITLSYRMRGHFPADLSVTWLRRDRGAGAAVPLQDSDQYKIESGVPYTQDWKSFQQETRLSFTPSVQTDQGAEFICRVRHKALQACLERRSGELQIAGPSSAVETPPEDPAGSGDKTCGEDTVGMGNDGVSDAGEGSEQQPLLHGQSQEQSETQEQDGAQGTGRSDSPGSELSECQERGKAVAAAPGPRAPGPNGDSSANAEAGPAGPGMAGASAELAGQQGRDAAPSITTVGTRETAPNMVPATAQEEDVQGEPGDKGLLRPPEVSEISQPQSVTAGEEITLSCRMRGHFPADLSVTWLRRDRGAGAAVPLQDSDQYKIESGVPYTQDWKSFQQETRLSFTPSVQTDQGAEFICRVRHKALQACLERRSGELQIAGLLRPPEVSEISQPESVTAGEEIVLSCRMTGHYPAALSVTWLRRGRGAGAAVPLQGSAEYRIEPGAPHTQDWKSFQQETRLSFTPSVQRDQGAEYVCRVGHVALQTPLERRSRELQVTARPQVSGIQVLPHWEPPEEVPFAIQIQNFYPRGIHRIRWSWYGAESGRDETPEISQNPDLTFSATSVWRIPSDQITRPEFIVTVSVQQSPQEPLIEREIKAGDTGLLRPPEVSEISQPESVTAGEEITLSCRMGGHFPGALSVTWLRRGRGAGAAVPLQGSAEYRIDPGAPHTQDGKSFQQETRLSFTLSVQRDQGAEYICRVGHVALQTPLERRSRELQVTAQPQVSGIQVLPHWEPRDEVPFAIQIQNFYPREIHRIQWSCGGAESWRDESPEISQNPDLTFSATSVWRIPSQRLARPERNILVFIQQSPEGPSIRREIRAGDTGLLRPPEVSEISQPQSVTAGEEITLSCRMTGHFPGALSVTWLRRGRGAGAAVPLQGSAEYRIDPGAPHTQDGKSFQQETRLSFTPSVQRDQGAEYVCRVGHVTLQTPLERRSQELQVTARPQVSGIQVLPHWEPPEEVPFAVQIQNFYPREIHRIQWSWDGAESWRDETPEISQNPDLTFSATSVWRIPSDQITRPEFIVTVSVQQSPREPPIEREIRARDTGLLRPPEVSEISQPESVTAGEEITLSCRMTGHFPGALSVTWLRRSRGAGAAVPLQGSAEYRIEPGAPCTQDGKSFQQETRLSFTPSVQRDQGAEYVCRVGHVALQTPLERRSRELQVTARPQVSKIQVLPQWEPPEEVPFAVQIQNFYPRGIHRIRWSCDGAESWKDESPEISENPDLTFSATSVWRIPSQRLTRPERSILVFVQQSPEGPSIKREIRAGDTGLLRPPEVSEISQPQSVTAGEEITLSCRMTGHFPGVLSVTWLRRGRGAGAAVPLQGSAEYRIEPGGPRTQDGKSFQQETRLSFTPSVQRDQGAEYVCRVGHVTLQTPLERRSRELQVTAPSP